MTSSNCGGKPAGRKLGRGNGAELSPFEDFLADVLDLASSVDDRLASILRGEAEIQAPRLPWSGNRRQGLELCLSMLRYARADADTCELSQRIDDAIAYATLEVDRALRPDRPLH